MSPIENNRSKEVAYVTTTLLPIPDKRNGLERRTVNPLIEPAAQGRRNKRSQHRNRSAVPAASESGQRSSSSALNDLQQFPITGGFGKRPASISPTFSHAQKTETSTGVLRSGRIPNNKRIASPRVWPCVGNIENPLISYLSGGNLWNEFYPGEDPPLAEVVQMAPISPGATVSAVNTVILAGQKSLKVSDGSYSFMGTDDTDSQIDPANEDSNFPIFPKSQHVKRRSVHSVCSTTSSKVTFAKKIAISFQEEGRGDCQVASNTKKSVRRHKQQKQSPKKWKSTDPSTCDMAKQESSFFRC